MRNEKGQFTTISRKDFFQKNQGDYCFPSIRGNYADAEKTFVEFQEYEKNLPMLEKAFRNANCVDLDKFYAGCHIRKYGTVATCFNSFEDLKKEFYARMKKQAELVAIANSPVI